MVHFKVILDGDNSLPEIAGKWKEVELYAITALPNGMQSGSPSVAIVCKLEDGSFVLAQSSMKLFLSAARVMEVRYEEELKD